MTPELARELCEWSAAVGRRLGVVIDRRGRVLAVAVGDRQNIAIPEDTLTHRAPGRFSGLRWVTTGPFDDEPSERDLNALLRHRLDLYVQIAATPDGAPWSLREASLLPTSPGEDMHGQAQHRAMFDITEPLAPREARADLLAFLAGLEEELDRAHPQTLTTKEGASERVILITLGALGSENREPIARRERELEELARSAGADIIGRITQRRAGPDPRTMIGRGRVRDLTHMAVQRNADAAIFSCDLSAAQARALEDATNLKIIDRTQLILDLFAQSARSSGGKLQVELARLRYLMPRLVGRGEALSQVGGGIGSNRGVGEKKLELDRRSIRRRIGVLEKKYDALKRRRDETRRRRDRNVVDHIGLVGYTNAGKSTLFNRLTGAEVTTADRLFATLDPTLRRRRLPSGRTAVFSDTVGFIEDLPGDLIRAFGATLDELRDTRIRLHIVDISDPHFVEKLRSVRSLLRALELDSSPELLVFNKGDRIDPEITMPLLRQLTERPLIVSAQENQGISELVAAIDQALTEPIKPPRRASRSRR